jgi:hypothetical protein
MQTQSWAKFSEGEEEKPERRVEAHVRERVILHD